MVVATQSANVTLAVGGSPIMATEPNEMEDLTRICGALLINIGSVKTEDLNGMILAGTGALNHLLLTLMINKVPLPTVSKNLLYLTQLVSVQVLSERIQSRVGIRSFIYALNLLTPITFYKLCWILSK